MERITIRDNTKLRLFDLLETVENISSYFEHIDLYSVSRGALHFWIESLDSAWSALQNADEKDIDSRLLYELNNYSNEKMRIR